MLVREHDLFLGLGGRLRGCFFGRPDLEVLFGGGGASRAVFWAGTVASVGGVGGSDLGTEECALWVRACVGRSVLCWCVMGYYNVFVFPAKLVEVK